MPEANSANGLLEHSLQARVEFLEDIIRKQFGPTADIPLTHKPRIFAVQNSVVEDLAELGAQPLGANQKARKKLTKTTLERVEQQMKNMEIKCMLLEEEALQQLSALAAVQSRLQQQMAALHCSVGQLMLRHTISGPSHRLSDTTTCMSTPFSSPKKPARDGTQPSDSDATYDSTAARWQGDATASHEAASPAHHQTGLEEGPPAQWGSREHSNSTAAQDGLHSSHPLPAPSLNLAPSAELSAANSAPTDGFMGGAPDSPVLSDAWGSDAGHLSQGQDPQLEADPSGALSSASELDQLVSALIRLEQPAPSRVREEGPQPGGSSGVAAEDVREMVRSVVCQEYGLLWQGAAVTLTAAGSAASRERAREEEPRGTVAGSSSALQPACLAENSCQDQQLAGLGRELLLAARGCSDESTLPVSTAVPSSPLADAIPVSEAQAAVGRPSSEGQEQSIGEAWAAPRSSTGTVRSVFQYGKNYLASRNQR